MEENEIKPPGLMVRIFVPKRFHKYLTPEVFVAWNVSSWITILQVTLLQKYWPWLLSKIILPFAALLKVAWDETVSLGKVIFEVGT